MRNNGNTFLKMCTGTLFKSGGLFTVYFAELCHYTVAKDLEQERYDDLGIVGSCTPPKLEAFSASIRFYTRYPFKKKNTMTRYSENGVGADSCAESWRHVRNFWSYI